MVVSSLKDPVVRTPERQINNRRVRSRLEQWGVQKLHIAIAEDRIERARHRPLSLTGNL
jgi:hypothetical protein